MCAPTADDLIRSHCRVCALHTDSDGVRCDQPWPVATADSVTRASLSPEASDHFDGVSSNSLQRVPTRQAGNSDQSGPRWKHDTSTVCGRVVACLGPRTYRSTWLG